MFYLFTSQKGGKLTANGFWRLFKVIAAEAGVEGSLKHTRASLMMAGGAALSEVRQQPGHRALSSTLRYVHSTDAQAGLAARRSEANVFSFPAKGRTNQNTLTPVPIFPTQTA